MFLSLMILIYNGYRGLNRYLSGFLFFASFYIYTQLILAYSQDVTQVAILGIGFPTTYYLIGPLGYLYLRGILRDSKEFSKWDWLHFLPFGLVLLGAMPYIFFTPFEEKQAVARILISNNWTELSTFRPNKILNTQTNETIKAIQGILYSFLLWRQVYQHRLKLFGIPSKEQHRNLIRNWVLIFCLAYTMLVLMRIVYSTILLLTPSKSDFLLNAQNFHFIGALGFFGLNIALIAFPSILYGLPVVPDFIKKRESAVTGTQDNTENKAMFEEQSLSQRKYQKYFTPAYLEEIERALQHWISNEKYLDSDDSLAALAISVELPYHHLSYYFNYISEKKFIEWRNALKIAHACQLLKGGTAQTLTIEAIALASGFSSRVTFYRAFKQETGMTPSEYMDNPIR